MKPPRHPVRAVLNCGGKMRTCEVLETDDSGDECGQVCGRESIGRCYDCAIPACWKHFEECPTCKMKFCSGCVTFHVKDHPKAIQVCGRTERPGKDFRCVALSSDNASLEATQIQRESLYYQSSVRFE